MEVGYQRRHRVPLEMVIEGLRDGGVSATGVACCAERHDYVPAPEDDRAPRAFYLAVDEGTPFFGLERPEFVGNKWYVGYFRVGLDGPALCVYFDLTDAGLDIQPSETAACFDVVLGSDAQASFDAMTQ